jgi:hypothetical protein
MKTDDLIALMSTDVKPARPYPVTRLLGPAALVGAVVAFALLIVFMPMRDMGLAMLTPSYWMKTMYTAGIAAAGFMLVERLSRPGVSASSGVVTLVTILAALLGLAIVQLASTPDEGLHDAVFGTTWNMCPLRIVMLAIPGLAIGLYAMRRLAPTRPALAGAGLGVFIGGLAATIYGLHCAEISATFTLLWYTLGIALSTAIGALAGWRLLRW